MEIPENQHPVVLVEVELVLLVDKLQNLQDILEATRDVAAMV
jgi:hypothetical protein